MHAIKPILTLISSVTENELYHLRQSNANSANIYN